MSIFANDTPMQGARIMPPTASTGDGTGYDAFGKPVSHARRQAAYETMKSMGFKDKEQMLTVIGQMSEHIERDEPHAAMQVGVGIIDVTGIYRMLAVLCTDPA